MYAQFKKKYIIKGENYDFKFNIREANFNRLLLNILKPPMNVCIHSDRRSFAYFKKSS